MSNNRKCSLGISKKKQDAAYERMMKRYYAAKNKGQYEGKAEFESEGGSVAVRIGHGHAHRILEICSDSVVREAEKVATAMIAPLIEQQKEPPEFIKIGATK